MNWKKIFVATGFIVVGIALYLVSVFTGFRDSIEFTILLPIFMLAHIVLSILYPIKNYSKKILAVIVVLFLINVAISQIAFPACDSSHKTGQITSCDCLGLKKGELFSSQCIGVRTACYEYKDNFVLTNYTNPYSNITKEQRMNYPNKIEVPCP